jgi:hypothetical protein
VATMENLQVCAPPWSSSSRLSCGARPCVRAFVEQEASTQCSANDNMPSGENTLEQGEIGGGREGTFRHSFIQQYGNHAQTTGAS